MKKTDDPYNLPEGGPNLGFMIAVAIVLSGFLAIFLTMYFRYHR